MTWQSHNETGMIKEYERTYMGQFTSEIDVRFDTLKHRTTRPRTDRNRTHLTRYLRSSDVDFGCVDKARNMQPRDKWEETEGKEYAGRSSDQYGATKK